MLSEFCDESAKEKGKANTWRRRSARVHFLGDAVHSHLYTGSLWIDAEAEGRAT